MLLSNIYIYIYIYIYGRPVNLRVNAPRLFKFKKEKVIQWPRQITCYKAIGVATWRSHNESRASLPFAWRTTAHIRCVDITKLPFCHSHYNDVIMGAMVSQITSLNIVYSTVYSGADQRKYQSSVSLAFVRGIHRVSVEFPAQMASNAENVSIWWRHHVWDLFLLLLGGCL